MLKIQKFMFEKTDSYFPGDGHSYSSTFRTWTWDLGLGTWDMVLRSPVLVLVYIVQVSGTWEITDKVRRV